jgi:recombination protein RecA
MPPARTDLAKFAAKAQSKYGEDRIANGPPVVIVPSGSLALDRAFRVGGYQLGRIYEFLGNKDSGKSTVGIEALISHAAMFPDRGRCYVNLEKTFDPARATAMGLDCSDAAKDAGLWLPMRARSSEQASDMARDACSSGLYSIVVVDSVGAMESDRVMAKDAEKAADAMGRNARIISQMIKALIDEAEQNRCTVILINQPRANMSGFGGDISAGPKLMQHSSTAKVDFSARGSEEDVRKIKLNQHDDPVVVSGRHRMRVSRMKNGLAGRVAETWINRIGTPDYGPPGVDHAAEHLIWGTRQNVIAQGGSHYTFPDGKKINGNIAALTYLRDHPEVMKEVRAGIVFDDPTNEYGESVAAPETEETA